MSHLFALNKAKTNEFKNELDLVNKKFHPLTPFTTNNDSQVKLNQRDNLLKTEVSLMD